jgi:16S rRNA (guanine527-N7)-methyltransferase
MQDLLEQALIENGLTLEAKVKEQLLCYLVLLGKWNKVYNLTAITDIREMIYLHLIDSLIVGPYLEGQSCIDVGTGAGLPGIPLALAYPDTNWLLIDKNSKKIRFLTQVIAELNLKDRIDIAQCRVEDFQPGVCFDSILTRAFASLQQFVQQTSHLLQDHGQFIAMKGKYPTEELQAIPSDCYKVQQIARLELKGIAHQRHVICLRKFTRG